MASQDEYQQQQFFKQRGVWSVESDKFPGCSFNVSAIDIMKNNLADRCEEIIKITHPKFEPKTIRVKF